MERLVESPLNHRKQFGDISGLAEAIKAQGVLQPLLARPRGKTLEIVYGHRRFRAAKIAGVKVLPVMVREMSDVEVLEAQLVENIAREDPNQLEIAEGYRDLMARGNLTAEQVGDRLGVSRSQVFTTLKLLELVPVARDAYLAGRLGSAHAAVAIARVKGERAQLAALRVVEEAQKRAGAPLPSRVVQKIIAQGFAGQRTIKPVRPAKPEVPDAAVHARARKLLLARVAELVERKRGIEDVDVRLLLVALAADGATEERLRAAGVRLDRLGVVPGPRLRALLMEAVLTPWLATEGAVQAVARAYGVSWAETEKTARALLEADELMTKDG